MIYIKDEFESQTMRTAEDILKRDFDWQIKDDEMTGWVNEDEIEIISDLCDEIIRLRGENNG